MISAFQLKQGWMQLLQWSGNIVPECPKGGCLLMHGAQLQAYAFVRIYRVCTGQYFEKLLKKICVLQEAALLTKSCGSLPSDYETMLCAVLWQSQVIHHSGTWKASENFSGALTWEPWLHSTLDNYPNISCVTPLHRGVIIYFLSQTVIYFCCVQLNNCWLSQAWLKGFLYIQLVQVVTCLGVSLEERRFRIITVQTHPWCKADDPKHKSWSTVPLFLFPL